MLGGLKNGVSGLMNPSNGVMMNESILSQVTSLFLYDYKHWGTYICVFDGVKAFFFVC